MESNLVRITCPSCGAPIEASQLKKKIILHMMKIIFVVKDSVDLVLVVSM